MSSWMVSAIRLTGVAGFPLDQLRRCGANCADGSAFSEESSQKALAFADSLYFDCHGFDGVFHTTHSFAELLRN